MLTKMTVRNFKRFDDIEVELGNPVVFVGPNNMGKTAALQALYLWGVGLKKWKEKRGVSIPEKRTGVAINRKDLCAIPVPNSKLLWKDLHIRKGLKGGKSTQNIRIEVILEGENDDKFWNFGMEFDFANDESIYCRPLSKSQIEGTGEIPENVFKTNIVFLPPMSGLSSNEYMLQPGTLNVKIGEGRTAEVLRNLCYEIAHDENKWRMMVEDIRLLFGDEIMKPVYVSDRGEIEMSFMNKGGVELDISCTGRGMQQVILLLSYIYSNPESVILLDEPDAHLEIINQRRVYDLVNEKTRFFNNQLIVASHSEVLLNEAAEKGVLVAFLDRAFTINDRGSQLKKSLTDIGWEDFYKAHQNGWILYLEGSTDLSILKTLAKKLGHPAYEYLDSAFVKYIGNLPNKALEHYYGLCESKRGLKGLAIFDRLDKAVTAGENVEITNWKRREIENYICYRESLLSFASSTIEGGISLFTSAENEMRTNLMNRLLEEMQDAFRKLDKGDIFSSDLKVSNELLEPLFARFYNELELPNLMLKTNFHILAEHMPLELINPEITEKLDAIVKTAQQAIEG